MGKINTAARCLTAEQIIANNGKVIQNPDGTVSVYQNSQYGLFPVQITSECCSVINPNYYFDIDTQECRYAKPKTCSFSPEEPINLMVNPVGNDGALFFLDDTETDKCKLNISFDYLLKLKCEDLMNVRYQSVTLDTHSSQTLAMINDVETQISDLNAHIESLENEMVLLTQEIDNTYYSIKCDSFPILKLQNLTLEQSKQLTLSPSATTESLSVFDNSAFSKKSTSTEKPRPILVTSVNFCLTEYGLQIWEQILGPTRYQNFLNGDPASYSCADVIQIATNTYPGGTVILDCNVPFGVKTDLVNQLNIKTQELNNLNTSLTSLEEYLITLQNTFDTVPVQGKCTTAVNALETFDISMTLEIVNPDNTLDLVYEQELFNIGGGNLFNYLVSSGSSGLYVCGEPSCEVATLPTQGDTTNNPDSCKKVVLEVLRDLYHESPYYPNNDYAGFLNSVPPTALQSPWLNYTHELDENIVSMITNKKIKIGIKIKNACINFCFLMDNIHMDKTCVNVKRNDIFITKNPGFEFKRVIDNKKSWIDTQVPTNREFLIARNDNTHPIRQTDYDVNDERLVLNSKEIDLDISIASAIENDVWCFINDNPCIISAQCSSDYASIENPFIDGQILVFSGESITIDDCSDYNDIFSGRTPTVTTTPCGTILSYRIKTLDLIPQLYYYFVVQQPNGDVGLFYKNVSTFTNASNVYQNSKTCCEHLNTELSVYNNNASEADKIEVYWDDDCQRCKVEKAKCGDNNIDFQALVTQPISDVITIEGFENLMTSELIDAKNRQTISGYPTLRALYDRYLNSGLYCDAISSGFDYQNMEQFAGLVGNYWVDLIEQVMPSTTIWGSVKVHTNTIFDEQKFKYKSYSSLLCNNPFFGQNVLSPINGTSGETSSVSVNYTSLMDHSSPNNIVVVPSYSNCESINIAQMNSGSEFIGSVTIQQPTGCQPSDYIEGCNIRLTINVENGVDSFILVPNIFGAAANTVTYLWSNGATTSTLPIYSAGTYSLTITTDKCCVASATVEIPELEACWYSMPETPEYLMASLYSNAYSLCNGQGDYPLGNEKISIESLIINNNERLDPSTTYETNINTSTINWVPAINDIVFGCTLGNPTGFTYTNFVDFLNGTFNAVGAQFYRAQLSLKEQKVGVFQYNNKHNGFYILRPVGNTFAMKTIAEFNVDKYLYTENGLTAANIDNSWDWVYKKSFCSGITITNNFKVVE